MTDGRGSLKACRSRFVAVVSKMPKRTWQLNYKCISKESCVSILRGARGKLPEPGLATFLGEALAGEPIGSYSGAYSADSGLSVMAPGGAFLQFSPPLASHPQWFRDLECTSKILLERSLHAGQRKAQVHEEAAT